MIQDAPMPANMAFGSKAWETIMESI